jgi:hypothetical protein
VHAGAQREPTLLGDAADTCGHVGEGFIEVRPRRDGASPRRENEDRRDGGTRRDAPLVNGDAAGDAEKRRVVPVTGPEDHGDHGGLGGGVAREGAGHLDVEAVVGREVGRAHEQQDDVGAFEAMVHLAAPLGAGAHEAIAPAPHVALPLEEGEVLLQLLAERFVFRCVGEEDVDRRRGRHGLLPGENGGAAARPV